MSAVTCGGCGAVSRCFEDFLDLSLPIPTGRVVSIQVLFHWNMIAPRSGYCPGSAMPHFVCSDMCLLQRNAMLPKPWKRNAC